MRVTTNTVTGPWRDDLDLLVFRTGRGAGYVRHGPACGVHIGSDGVQVKGRQVDTDTCAFPPLTFTRYTPSPLAEHVPVVLRPDVPAP